MSYKIYIVTGFRADQKFSLDAEEAHRAYYLFSHPTEQVIFSNGLAIRGADIRMILPDYNGTMGWNESHQLTGEDWNEVKKSGADKKLQSIMEVAKEVAKIAGKQAISLKLQEAAKKFTPQLLSAPQ